MMKIKKIVQKVCKICRNPKLLLLYTKFSRILSDEVFVSLAFQRSKGKKLDLLAPSTFNAKLQWLKLYDRNPLLPHLVDKFEVRSYVKKKIGERYLVPLYGIWDKFEDIDFNSLPNQFVLKCTHDSGSVIICKDKATINIKNIKSKFNKALKKNFYYSSREWPYKDIKPRIICEKFLMDESGYELKDYKVFCFNGEPKIIQVDFNRFLNHKRNLYSIDWEYLNFEIRYPSDKSVSIKKPVCLDEILTLSRKLSNGFPHVRVDFYIIGTTIFFGELTFFHEAGFGKFTPECFDYLLGSWIDLSLVEKNQKEDDNVRKEK